MGNPKKRVTDEDRERWEQWASGGDPQILAKLKGSFADGTLVPPRDYTDLVPKPRKIEGVTLSEIVIEDRGT